MNRRGVVLRGLLGSILGLCLGLYPFMEARSQGTDIERYAGSGKGSRARTRSQAQAGGPTWAERNPEFMQELTTGIYRYLLQDPTLSRYGIPTQYLLQGFNYIPRYALKSWGDRTSLTVGSNAGLVLQFSNLGSIFMVNLPLLVELNVGRGSRADNEDPVGLYAGLGVEYNFVNDLIPKLIYDTNGVPVDVGFGNLNQVALLWTAGIRARVAGRPYVLRFAQTVGVPSQQVRVFHIGFGVSMF